MEKVELKTFKKVESKEEIKEILKEEENNVDWNMKMFDFYKLSDGIIFKIKKTPTINTEIWYDDETEPPKLTEKLFIDINLKFASEYYIIDEKSENMLPFLVYKRYNNDKIVSIQKLNTICDYIEEKKYAINKGVFAREMTIEEISDLNVLMNFYTQKYIKRLQNYYKRYADKIQVSGYWANR